MAIGSDFDADLRSLEGDLRKLEAEYTMFFGGQLPRPPWETRRRVEQALKRLERTVVASGTALEKFRHQTLQSRMATFADLWDRGLRAREEGRPGPFVRQSARAEPAAAEKPPGDRVVHVTVLKDPASEADRLRDLYDRLTEAGRELGATQVPFHKFAGLIRDKVAAMKEKGVPEVAFKVAVHEGKVTLTARGVKGSRSE